MFNEYRTQNNDHGEHLLQSLMTERDNHVIDVITQKIRLNYEIKYDM